MRSRATLFVILMVVQMACALDSVPKAEYRQRRVKLAAQLHGGSALIFAAHEPSLEYQDYRQDEDFYYLTGSNEDGGALLIIGDGPATTNRLGPVAAARLSGSLISAHAQSRPREVHRREDRCSHPRRKGSARRG